MRMRWTGTAGALLVAVMAGGADAATPAAIQQGYADFARAQAPRFAGFSAQRGARFFAATHGGDWSCTSCHTNDPTRAGRHAKTAKSIAPLAPVANGERFTDAARVEKWFRRNCHDVLGRACTAQEKGDVMEYLLSLEQGGA